MSPPINEESCQSLLALCWFEQLLELNAQHRSELVQRMTGQMNAQQLQMCMMQMVHSLSQWKTQNMSHGASFTVEASTGGVVMVYNGSESNTASGST